MTQTLRADQSGMALIYATVLLPVVIGFALLAVDVGRFTTLNSSLQHGADALALAGAAELDGRPDSIDRAESAMAQFITDNTALFTSSAADVDWSSVRKPLCFMAKLPDSDATPIAATDCLIVASEDDRQAASLQARYVQVIITPKDYDTIFPATFVGAISNRAVTSAEAVAGFSAAVCNFTPLLMCNPFEDPDAALGAEEDVYKDYGLFDHIESEAFRRQQIALKSHDAQWAPGNFGFLEAFGGPGAKELAYSIASTKPEGCFVLDNLTLKTSPGNIETLKKAFNVRFGLYPSGNIGGATAQSYPPAKNVRKGYVLARAPNRNTGGVNGCNESHVNPVSAFQRDYLSKPDYTEDFTVAMGLPRDKCHVEGNCTEGNGRTGGGDWGGDIAGTNDKAGDFEQYWSFNHSSTPPSERDLDIDINGDGVKSTSPVTNSHPPSRYAVYRYEIEKGLVSNPNKNTNLDFAGVQETGTPSCQASNAVDDPDRRVVYGAIVNCRANDLDGGKNTQIRALAFGKFFMTEPMQGSSASDTVLYTELIGVAEPGEGNGVVRDIVQLYR